MQENSRLKILFGFAAVYIIWGSTYLAIRFGVETMPPLLMCAFRFLVSGLAIYAWMRLRGTPRPARSHWRPAIVIGLLAPAGGTGLVSVAETTVPSGLTALLVAMVPMWIVLADRLRPGGERPTMTVIAGLIMGLIGVALLINPTDIGGPAELDKFGAFLIVIATISWALGSIYSRHADQPQSKILSTSMQMIAGGIGLLVASLVTGETVGFDITAVSTKSWLSLLYLTSVGSVAFVAYIWLISATSPTKAATYAFVNPVIALLLGGLLAGELFSQWTLICSMIIIVAVVLIIMSKGQAADSRAIQSSSVSINPVRCPSK